MLTGTASAIPVLIIGALADHLGIAPMLLALAVLVGVAGIAGWPWRRRAVHSAQ
jgi:hypothetical protein